MKNSHKALPTLFLDTSVIIAALLSSTGGSFRICRESGEEKIRLFTNEYVYDEVLDVLRRKYPNRVRAVEDFCTWSHIVIRKNPSPAEVRRVLTIIHPEDAPVLAGALRTKSNFLVSLDRKDFLNETVLQSHLPLHIVTPQIFFQEHWNLLFG